MLSVDQVRKRLREKCDAAGSQAAWAKAHGVSAAYVSDVIAGRREPGEAILKAFKLRKIVLYEHEVSGAR